MSMLLSGRVSEGYTQKCLTELSEQERCDLREKLNSDLVICPVCFQWVKELVRIPTRYEQYVLTPFKAMFGKRPQHCCMYCMSNAASLRLAERSAKYDEERGIIRMRVNSLDKDKPGFVYVAEHRSGLFKIGATTVSVSSRLSAQGGRTTYVLWDVLGTHLPFTLERYFHKRYQEKRRVIGYAVEFFNLTQHDLSWIASVVSINGVCVTHHKQESP